MPVPQVVTNVANGAPAIVPDDIATTCAVIGYSSSATAVDGTYPPKVFSRRALAIAEYTDGPLVRAGVHLVDTVKRSVIFQHCEASNPGEYATVDTTGFTGTALPISVAATVPDNEAELYIEFVNGGTFGTDGITYKKSTADGRIDLSGVLRLGTATQISFGTTNAAIEFDPPLADMLTYVNELVDEFEDHVALTSGGVHGAADTGPYTISGTAASQSAAITRLVQTIAAAKLHVVKTSSSIHGAADNTALAALNAITTPTTGQTLITAAIAFEAAFFGDGVAVNSGHTMRTASSVHGAIDSTNVIVSSVPSRGTAEAGDIVRCKTRAPYPSTGELAAAFQALATSAYTPGFVVLPGRTPAGHAATISAGLDLMKENGKPCRVLVQARQRTDSDSTLQDFRDNLETEVIAVDDTRICWVSTDTLCTISEGATLVVPAERFAGYAANMAAYRAQIPFWQTTWQVGKGKLPGVRLVDDDGVVVGWDEPIDIDTRLQLLYQVPNALLGRPTVAAPDYTLAGADEALKTLQAGLVEDEIIRVIEAYHWSQVGLTQKIAVTSPGVGVFADDTLRQSLQRSAAARLQARSGLQQAVSDLEAADLVYLNPEVSIVQGVIYLEFVVKWTPAYPIGRVTTTIAVRTGA